MPRRILDYPDAFAGWNAVASFGSYISALSAIYFFYIVYLTLAEGPKCSLNPWTGTEGTAGTLEWVLPSPPAFHTFGDQMPVIRVTPLVASNLFKETRSHRPKCPRTRSEHSELLNFIFNLSNLYT